jgi:hypothetical protein
MGWGRIALLREGIHPFCQVREGKKGQSLRRSFLLPPWTWRWVHNIPSPGSSHLWAGGEALEGKQSQVIPNLTCFKLSLGDNSPKIFLWGCWRGVVHVGSCFKLTRGCRPNLSGIWPLSYHCSWGLEQWCLLSESWSSPIKIAHGHLIHLQKLAVLSCYGLGFKGFYPGRDKHGLESMTWTSIMIGTSEAAMPDVAGRLK